jgi:hypothetical protein
MGDLGRIPVLSWKEPFSMRCSSRRMAADAETAVLVAAAKAGMWIGGEWIAGCENSARLALTPVAKAYRKDARHRIRQPLSHIREAADGR